MGRSSVRARGVAVVTGCCLTRSDMAASALQAAFFFFYLAYKIRSSSHSTLLISQNVNNPTFFGYRHDNQRGNKLEIFSVCEKCALVAPGGEEGGGEERDPG